MLSEVCKDTEIEPKLTPLTAEELDSRTANATNEAKLDIKARGVWGRGQHAFLDLRVFDPKPCRYLKKSLQQCHVMKNKKRKVHTMRKFCKLNMVHLHHFFQFMEVWGGNAVGFIQDYPIYCRRSVIYQNR